MNSFLNTVEESPNDIMIVSPREKCVSCGSLSGPTFILSELGGPLELLRRNLIPTGDQLELVESNISYAQGEITRIDKELDGLKKSIAALEERRDALIRFEFQERSLMAPIRKLPEDILRRIFRQVHLAGSGEKWIDASDPMEFVRTAPCVSAYWRSVAHSCAFLWSKVNIDVGFGGWYLTNQDIDESAQLLGKCILYSSNAPFSARLGVTCTPEILGDRLIKLLIDCAYRWSKISITNGELLHSIVALLQPQQSFGQLHALTLGYLIDSCALPPTPRLHFLTISNVTDHVVTLQEAPSLRALCVMNMHNVSILLGGLPWSQLTHFYVHDTGFDEDELPIILTSMPNLVELSLQLEDTRTEVPLILPRLEVLKLIGPSSNNACDILTLPSLTTLDVTFYYHVTGISNLVRRSGCTIEELRLYTMYFDGLVWKEPEFRSIKTLQWNDSRHIDEFIRWLQNVEVTDNLFPQLTTLIIQNIGADTHYMNEHYLIELLRSCLPDSNNTTSNIALQSLKTVKITFDDNGNESDFISLKEFIRSNAVEKSGINVSIVDSEGYKIC